jgi:solute carrier family 12 (potassium/chloride transporters), member 9
LVCPEKPLPQPPILLFSHPTGLLLIAYLVNFLTTLSLSAIASNGEVKGGGAYYLISRSLGPEFGGSIGVLFYLSLVLNTSLNIVGLVDCFKLNLPQVFPQGYWVSYGMQTAALVFCLVICLAGSAILTRAGNGLLIVLIVSSLSIPFSVLVQPPFRDADRGIDFTGPSWVTIRANLLPHTTGPHYHGLDTFRELFGVLFPATSGILAGASMSGVLRNPSKDIPKGTLWAILSTLILYCVVILSMASSVTHESLLRNPNIIYDTNLWSPLVLAGECAISLFSAMMGLVGASNLLTALSRFVSTSSLCRCAFRWLTSRPGK